MTLQQAVFAGLVNPGNIVAVREILTSSTTDTDVALFSDVRTNYEITLGSVNGESFLTVAHTGGTAGRRCRHSAQRGDPAVRRRRRRGRVLHHGTRACGADSPGRRLGVRAA